MDFVSIKEASNIVTIAMDDGKANAMGFQMLSELNDALDATEKSAKATILTGRQGLLSGGFDLKVIREGSEEDVTRLVSRGVQTLMRLFGYSRPLIIVVPGHAVALGGFLTLVGDYRIGVSGDFKIGLNETSIGLPLPMFGVELVRSRLNSRYITRSAISAELFGPDEAKEAGFLDQVVSEIELVACAESVAQRLSSLDLPSFAKTKYSFRRGLIDRVLSRYV